MKNSKTSSIMKNYGVTQEQVECLLDNLRTSELMRAQTDETV